MKVLIVLALLLHTAVAQVDPVSTYTQMQSGDGTYYGAITSGGKCTLDMASGAYPSTYRAGMITVAINAPTYANSLSCGMCVQGNGTGVGLGLDPVGPFSAIVTDLCPECVAGDLDLAQGLDGRWKIEWKAVNCVPTGGIEYHFQGSSVYYIKIQPRNTVVPIKQLDIWNPNTNAWSTSHRVDDNFFLADGPFPLAPPLKVRLIPITNESPQEDIVSAITGIVAGQNNVQFVGFTSGGTTAPSSTTATPASTTTTPGTTTVPAGTITPSGATTTPGGTSTTTPGSTTKAPSKSTGASVTPFARLLSLATLYLLLL